MKLKIFLYLVVYKFFFLNFLKFCLIYEIFLKKIENNLI